MSFVKIGYQLTLFTAGDSNRENGSVQTEAHIIFKHLYEFEGFGAKRLMKEFTTKGRKTF